ncbi:hypothetical protein [Nocardia macrotermitis]|uniref:Guanylate cyclase n=1 Tax=Nocardia macrotermitis TaxID=2585198 RepID=A0A7K0DAK2_9NOCA|nr:hypothetical protein [Nocardia macrotermitis]MQY22708.1 hypothetical protein [Nocardia macrotermitis]
MAGTSIHLDRALELTRTGDLWLFRGHSAADRAIRMTTNSPVNHVGMVIAVDDLPVLIWHAELGRSLPDMWSGKHQRGAQLHDLREAVLVWAHRYGQSAWLRQLDRPVTHEMEDAALRTVARLDGLPFPSTSTLAARWFGGRLARVRDSRRVAHGDPVPGQDLSSAYCAEVVALTYQSMGLLPERRANWYDPGRFWSGDTLRLNEGYHLGGEIPIDIPPAPDAEHP